MKLPASCIYITWLWFPSPHVWLIQLHHLSCSYNVWYVCFYGSIQKTKLLDTDYVVLVHIFSDHRENTIADRPFLYSTVTWPVDCTVIAFQLSHMIDGRNLSMPQLLWMTLSLKGRTVDGTCMAKNKDSPILRWQSQIFLFLQPESIRSQGPPSHKILLTRLIVGNWI